MSSKGLEPTAVAENNNYVPHRRGGAHSVFGEDPASVDISVSVTLSCLHDIS